MAVPIANRMLRFRCAAFWRRRWLYGRDIHISAHSTDPRPLELTTYPLFRLPRLSANWTFTREIMTETRVERMNHEIAGTLLNEEITRLRTLSYAALANCIDKPTSTFVNGP